MSAETFTAPTAPPSVEGGLPRRSLSLPRQVRLSGRTVVAILCVLLGVSLWHRTMAIHVYYWIDEGIAVGIASHPLAHIPALMRQDGSPPLYYLLLHVWVGLFGSGQAATHALSLLFAMLCIPVAYWAGASLFDRRAGVVSAALVAGVPYLTTYADETRMYALVALLSLIISASFVHTFVRRRRRYLPVFSLSLAAAVYSHNWALFLGAMTVATYLWCVWRQPEDRRGLWRDGALGFGTVAVLFAPWLPTLFYQSQHTGAPWDLPPVVWSLSQGIYQVVGGRGVAMLLLLAGGSGLLALRRPALAPAARGAALAGDRGNGARSGDPANGAAVERGDGVSAADPGDGAATERVDGSSTGDTGDGRAGEHVNGGAVARRLGHDAKWRLWQEALVLLILGFGTLLAAWLYAKTTPSWAPRYLGVIVGPLLLAFALGVSRAGRLGLVALALTLCFWILDPIPIKKVAKSNVATVAAEITPHLRADPLVLSAQPEQVPVLAYYLPHVRNFATPLGRVHDPRVVDWRDVLPRFERSSVRSVLVPMLDAVRPGQRVVLVVPMSTQKKPKYLGLVKRASTQWSDYLAHDRAFRSVMTSDANWTVSAMPMYAYVYQKRG